MNQEKLALGMGALLAAVGVALIVYFGFFRKDTARQEAEWRAREEAVGKITAQLEDLGHAIQSAQGDALCEKDHECRVVGLGAKVCGEFKDALIYSVRDAKEQKLLSLVKDFNTAHEKLTEISLAANTCGKKLPQVQCLDGHCR